MRKWNQVNTSLITALKATAKSGDLSRGQAIHAEIRESGSIFNLFIQNTLIDMYSKCGSMRDARQVFDSMPHRSVVSWTNLMLGYARNDREEAAIQLFQQMLHEGHEADAQSLVAVIRACTGLATKEYPVLLDGKLIKLTGYNLVKEFHSQAEKLGFESDSYVRNSLLDAYAKCGRLAEAEQLFWDTPDEAKNPVFWTCIIQGYANSGQSELGIYFFALMQLEGFSPDAQAFLAACKACSGMRNRAGALKRGVKLWSQVLGRGLDWDLFLASAMVDMFAKLGSMVEARKIFNTLVTPDVVCWTALVLGYSQNGEEEEALEMFSAMQKQGCEADPRTIVAALLACVSVAEKEEFQRVDGRLLKLTSLENGMRIHSLALKLGWDRDLKVASTLVDFYCKCGDTADALRVFRTMRFPDVVSWTALVLGLVHNGMFQAGLRYFRLMFQEGCSPDSKAFAAALKACGALGDVKSGSLIQVLICSSGLEKNAMLVSSLVEMLCKCGRMNEALDVFREAGESSKSDVVLWTSLMAGYCRQGDLKGVLQVFEAMQESGVQPDGIIFTYLLTACSHAGTVEKSREFLEMMLVRYEHVLENEHFHIVVDVLGRANRIEEACEVVRMMPCGGSLVAWNTLLAACEKWGNVEIGRLAFQRVLALDENFCAAYVLMANVCTPEEKKSVKENFEENISLKTKLVGVQR